MWQEEFNFLLPNMIIVIGPKICWNIQVPCSTFDDFGASVCRFINVFYFVWKSLWIISVSFIFVCSVVKNLSGITTVKQSTNLSELEEFISKVYWNVIIKPRGNQLLLC